MHEYIKLKDPNDSVLSEYKIKDLVGEGILNNTTTLVLVNAIYFKGTWDQQFLKSWTENAEFRLDKVKNTDENTKPKVHTLTSLIFTVSSSQLEKLLTYDKIMEWTSPEKMPLTKVDVRLPGFQMEEKCDLKKVLTRMGMVDAFDQAKGMSGTKKLFLSEATHKAVLEMNEEGTEAAAATEAGWCFIRRIPKSYFFADHPFLFFIHHNLNRNILFTGRFCSP
uniref:Serpin B6 n=1 Tax=Oryzias latipes TaxID=8090 RepID=A0A3P9ITF8_ORYLA